MAFAPSQVTASIFICDFTGTVTAETGTVETSVTAAGHGLSTDDFIVNATQTNTSRRILSTTTDTFTVVSVSGQGVGDSIRTYEFTDHTDLLKDGTFNLVKKIEENTEVRFTLVTDTTYIPRVGQYIKINLGGVHRYTGKIARVSRRLPQNGIDTKIFCDIECASLKIIPTYRTVNIAYEIETASDEIVTSLCNSFLVSEGIATGTIDTGILLPDDWYDDSLSISDIYDNLAQQNGFQWLIDKDFNLNFYQDPAAISTYSQTIDSSTTASFVDFRNVIVEETLDNYHNKAFYAGNTDDHGNLIIVSKENTTAITEIRDITAGTGVYGTVVRDSNLQSHEFYTAEAGTTETEIVITGADSLVTAGDLIYNIDGFERTNVVSVSGNTITTVAVSGQTEGQTIAIYESINDLVDNHLRRSSVIPKRLEFDSFTTDFEPGQKLEVILTNLGLSQAFYVIEEVSIQDRGAKYMVAHVVATIRDNSDFSTQKTPDYKDYYKDF